MALSFLSSGCLLANAAQLHLFLKTVEQCGKHLPRLKVLE